MKAQAKTQSQKSIPKNRVEKETDKQMDKKYTDKHQIPRNVNYYSHFLEEPYITEKDIEWVLQLRNIENSEMAARLARIPNFAFSKSDQKLESQKFNRLSRDVTYQGNSTPVLHLLKGRIGPTPHISQAEFETGLRSYTMNDKTLQEKERNWTTVPKTQRKQEFPEFLPNVKVEKEKRKSLSIAGKIGKISYSGFDPDINYPPYEMKFVERNIQNVKHMFVPNIKMSTVQWQNGLRPLTEIKRSAAPKDQMKKSSKK